MTDQVNDNKLLRKNRLSNHKNRMEQDSLVDPKKLSLIREKRRNPYKENWLKKDPIPLSAGVLLYYGICPSGNHDRDEDLIKRIDVQGVLQQLVKSPYFRQMEGWMIEWSRFISWLEEEGFKIPNHFKCHQIEAEKYFISNKVIDVLNINLTNLSKPQFETLLIRLIAHYFWSQDRYKDIPATTLVEKEAFKEVLAKFNIKVTNPKKFTEKLKGMSPRSHKNK